MKTMAVGQLKAEFSSVLDEVRRGHPVAIGFGKGKTKVAVIVPIAQYEPRPGRALGVLEGKARYRTRKDFGMSDESFLAS